MLGKARLGQTFLLKYQACNDELVRLRTLLIFQELMLDPASNEAQVPFILWKHLILASIEQGQGSSDRKSLKKQLDFATHFYKALAVRIRIKNVNLNGLSACLMALGDLSILSLESGDELLDKSRHEAPLKGWYQKAFRVYPYSGLPHARLASICTSDLESHYYAVLSLGNVKSVSDASEQLEALYSKSENGSKDPVTFNYLLCVGAIYSDSHELDVLSKCTIVLNEFTRNSIDQVHLVAARLVTPVLVLVEYLTTQFLESDSVALKKHCRFRQVLLLSIAFQIACLEREFKDTESLEVIGILLTFMNAHPWIELFIEYAKQMDPVYHDTLIQLIQRLARMYNTLTEITDDQGFRFVPEMDGDLIGLKGLENLYQNQTVNRNATSDYSDVVQAVFHRLDSFLLKATQYLPLKSIKGHYFLETAETKAEQMQVLMRSMAGQLLQDQVDTLQSQMETRYVPIFILDTLVFIHDLKLVRSWVISRKCVLAISYSVFIELDELKSGMDQVNVAARTAIRFLDSRLEFKSPCIVSQSLESFQSTPTIQDYFNILEKEYPDSQVKVVCDDPELTSRLKSMQIPTLTPNQVSKSLGEFIKKSK